MVTHTDQVLEQSQLLLSSLQDAETGQRGFLITGALSYLEPYKAALATIHEHFDRLKELTRDNPEQQQRLDEMHPLVEGKLAVLRRTIELRRRGPDGFEAARAMVSTNEGKALMDHLRVQVAALSATEIRLKDKKERMFSATAESATRQFLLGALVSIAVISWSILLMQKRQRELVLESERLRITLASIGDAVIVTDNVGRVTLLNRVAEHLTGWNTEEAIDRPLSQVFHLINGDTHQQIANLMDRVRSEGGVVGFADEHTVLVAKDETEYPIVDSGAPVRDSRGLIVGSVFVFRDQTDERQKTLKLKEVQENLRSTNGELNSLNTELSKWVSELERLNGDLQNLFESTQIATIFLDGQGRIVRFTPAATAVFRLTDDDVGRPLSEFASRFDAKDFPKEVERVLETLEPLERTVGMVDAKCWFLMRMHPYRTPSNVIAGLVVSFIDVTRLKETEAALRQTMAERERAEGALREENRRKNEFLGVLSHELRNPLTPIRNAIHILKRVPEGSDQASRAKAVIERQTNQLSRLVDDLLDVTRISRGKIQLRRSRVELTYLLRQVVEDHRPTFASRNVALSLCIDDEPQWIDADATRIEQSIGNLLHNAAKFTNAHGHVAVRVGQDGPSQAAIHITDDGIGIAHDMLDHVFEPFTQAESSLHRGQGGLGLGLALAKGLIEMHGGRVEARSRGLGKGTEFIISLPVLPEAGVPLESSVTAPATAGRLRLLVIEDHLDAVETLKEVLEMSGHEVVVAHNGHEGVAKAHSFKPDVVICDIGLPGLNGYEVARQIRADPSLSPTLIALTGYTRLEDQNESFKAGFDHHLGKPVRISDLEQVLAAATAPPTSRRLLVVDDNDALRSNIRELFEGKGWEVREARDGKEAVEAVAEFHPAVMLLDYRLPEIDGSEVLRRLGVTYTEPRVVLMTASAEVREIAMQHGLRFYVPKPFRSDDLLDTVEHARSGS